MSTLRFLSYVSLSKIDQLYEQIVEQAGEDRSTAPQTGDRKPGFLRKVKKAVPQEVEVGKMSELVRDWSGGRGYLQKLNMVLEYIEEREEVPDLVSLAESGPGTPLTAFAYSVGGEFSVLGKLSRRKHSYGLRINESALNGRSDDLVISKQALIDPSRLENEHVEIGPNGARIVSDIALIATRVGDYQLQLACSYKYFGQMGGH
ncbi:hypothetical protein [Amycolatopsis sp. cmx-8-4]|uniref:hypothetical protein n=1 Tax=Amycolatopsis sp. cmx-8-4 TaxID=2790947 RepID=UPI0039781B27